jgi:hypothetical protein
MAVTLFARSWSTLESTHGSAVAETMKRDARNEHIPYEQEHLAGDLCAVRVFSTASPTGWGTPEKALTITSCSARTCSRRRTASLPTPARQLAERRLPGLLQPGDPTCWYR